MRRGVLIFLLSFFIAALLTDIAVRIASAGTAQRAAVIADEQSSTIRFVIGGKEAARIDATGLYVRDQIVYGGALTDTGPAFIDEYMAGGRDAP